MTEHCLMFTAGIDQHSMAQMVKYTTDLQRAGATKLTIGMSSQGGNVVAGITMYNVLRAARFHVVIHNIGNIDSIANAVFLAGDERAASPTATFMFHGVGFDGNPNERLEEKNLMEKLDIVQAEHKRISDLIAARSSLDVEACLTLFKEQRTRNASWAVSNGVAHGIAEFFVPAGIDIRYLT